MLVLASTVQDETYYEILALTTYETSIRVLSLIFPVLLRSFHRENLLVHKRLLNMVLHFHPFYHTLKQKQTIDCV